MLSCKILTKIKGICYFRRASQCTYTNWWRHLDKGRDIFKTKLQVQLTVFNCLEIPHFSKPHVVGGGTRLDFFVLPLKTLSRGETGRSETSLLSAFSRFLRETAPRTAQLTSRRFIYPPRKLLPPSATPSLVEEHAGPSLHTLLHSLTLSHTHIQYTPTRLWSWREPGGEKKHRHFR